MVIDFHVHSFPDELAARAVPELAKVAGIPARLDGTLSAIRHSMKETGIDKSVVLSIATRPSQTSRVNDWSVSINSGSIIAFGSIHPVYAGWKDELNKLKVHGIKGIKLHPDYQHFYVDDPDLYTIYEHAFNLGFIIVFHAGLDIGLPPPYHCTPQRLLKVQNDFPGGRIIAAHMGGYSYWDDVEKYLVGTPVYFDTSMSIGRMDEQQIKRILNNHDLAKILFATDSPWSGQQEELARLKSLGLEEKALESILGGNAMKLLGTV